MSKGDVVQAVVRLFRSLLYATILAKLYITVSITWISLRAPLLLCLSTCSASLVARPHPVHTRKRGLVSQVQIFGPAEVPKPCNY